jgi:eukaryotic-like serine/threonine-protein kinase
MSLASGARLGPYEIVAPIGAGGMGEVYRARDTRLDRLVAVKILLRDTALSPDALTRFEREARSISQLSHPHICPLFDVGEENGIRFLVMQLLDGETLSDRLGKGPFPVDVTLRYAGQMAEALDVAHRAGIIHRDLKPANVMVTKSGIRLLDFGLAKPAGRGTAATVTVPATAEGAIAGTLHYMAPEVFEGRAADHRSDIYALGAVIYEMATGERLFGSAPKTLTPPALDRIVRSCIARDPDERWQSAHDVRLQLAAIGDGDTGSAAAARPTSSWLAWGVAALAVIAASWLAWSRDARGTSDHAAAPIAFDIAPPESGAFVDSVEANNLALSPDGSQLAYVASDAGGVTRVWLRSMSSSAARSLPGTEGSRHVFWAPDGKAIGFAVGEKLMRMDLPAGAPVTIADIPDVRLQATWGAAEILYSILPGGILRVPVSGGRPVSVLQPDRAKGEVAAGWPWFLPDGKRFLYLVRRPDGSGVLRIAEVGQPARDVVEASSMAQVLDGRFLVYTRESTLLAQRFDSATATVSGDPISIAEPVRYFQPTGAGTFSVSQGGVLAYQSHLERGRLVWLDRSGRETGAIGDDSGYARARLSPDGRRVLFARAQMRMANAQVWSYEIDRNVEQRVTSSQYTALNPVWLPDGRGFLFSGRIPPRLMLRGADAAEERELVPGEVFTLGEDISPDGRTLVFTQRTPRGSFDMWTMPLDDASKRTVMAETPFDEASVRFSRDGRYLAYAADELGSYEVFVSSYPQRGTPIRVSTRGGALPRWSRDGKELFYISGDGWLMATPVTTAPTFSAGEARRLFAIKPGGVWADIKTNVSWPDYDVSLDGTRFLAIIPEPANRKPVTALVNWRPPAP